MLENMRCYRFIVTSVELFNDIYQSAVCFSKDKKKQQKHTWASL